VKGTIDFQYDFHNDLVLAKSRWLVDTPAEAMRWYQTHARYFTARFSRPKDLIAVDDAFDLAPEVSHLWRGYCAKLQESFVRFMIRVKNGSRVQAPASKRAAGHGNGTIEVPTVADALATVLVLRRGEQSARPSAAMRTVRSSSTQTLGTARPMKSTK
jgi:hypothetical protein